MLYLNKYNYLIACLVLTISLCGTVYRTATAAPDEAFGAEPMAIAEMLESGGYVVYFRHTETDRSHTDSHPHNFDDCSTQRNLSEAGRMQAKAIGEAIRALKIPIGEVITSPFCRCKDTARLAFGKSEVSFGLSFGLGADANQTARLSQALKAMLSTPPPRGTNTVLVSHTANLKEATDLWPEPEGAAYIFRPGDGEGYKFIGRLPPDAWEQLSVAR